MDIDELLPFFTQSYSIPIEFRSIVKTAINRYAQPHKYHEETLNQMVNKTTSPLDTFKYLSTNDGCSFNYSQWKGHIAEWIVCYEYNSMKNNGNVVFTFVNPDSSSKADILHIIKVGNFYKCIAGPDIKTGRADYLLNQLEKVWSHEGSIPFYDFYNVLSDEKKLTEKQLNKLNQIKNKYPKKVILTPSIKHQEIIKFSDKYLRKVANQLTGPRASAVKKAKQNARDTIKKVRPWNQFNYDTYVKESFEKQVERLRKEKELEIEKQLYEISNRQQQVLKQNNSKMNSWLTKMGKAIVNSPIGQYVKDNKAEIIISAAIRISSTIINTSTSKKPKNKESGVIQQSPEPTPNIQIKDEYTRISPINEDDYTRKSPIKHQVPSYLRKDGTPVRGYTRGKD
ncbi:hypothetical protein [Neobacillus sp. CF12]|uniref:hypothetical protein n=1 Tax=Neobacillus sp. CF12 TaxID=3055864 RepID=UPI0025A0D8D7|nr:hypothetical protein [Neobacillus sp. CF12]MDM5326799.1 hypothetical protein [Neobacillus sp. CF12]